MWRLTAIGSRVTSSPQTTAVPEVGESESGNHFHCCRLARPVRAQKTQHFAAFNREAYIIHCDELTKLPQSGL